MGHQILHYVVTVLLVILSASSSLGMLWQYISCTHVSRLSVRRLMPIDCWHSKHNSVCPQAASYVLSRTEGLKEQESVILTNVLVFLAQASRVVINVGRVYGCGRKRQLEMQTAKRSAAVFLTVSWSRHTQCSLGTSVRDAIEPCLIRQDWSLFLARRREVACRFALTTRNLLHAIFLFHIVSCTRI